MDRGTGGRVDGWTGGRVDGWTGGRLSVLCRMLSYVPVMPIGATLPRSRHRVMSIVNLACRRVSAAAIIAIAALPSSLLAQASVNETRDPNQRQDPEFVSFYKMWTHHGSPLVDHLPLVSGIPTPKDVLGYYIGAPAKLTYYADILEVLSRARQGDAAREGRDDRQVRRRPRARRRLGVVGGEHQESRSTTATTSRRSPIRAGSPTRRCAS